MYVPQYATEALYTDNHFNYTNIYDIYLWFDGIYIIYLVKLFTRKHISCRFTLPVNSSM